MDKIRRHSDRAKYVLYFFATLLVASEIYLNLTSAKDGILFAVMNAICIISFYGSFFSLLVYSDRKNSHNDIIQTN